MEPLAYIILAAAVGAALIYLHRRNVAAAPPYTPPAVDELPLNDDGSPK